MTERAFKGILILLALVGLMMFFQGRSWAATRMVNNVAGSAFFIDDTFTSTGASAWGTYYNYKLTVKDTSGNTAWGYVGAAGTGVSTFSANLFNTPTFGADADWVKYTNWAIGGGTANCDGSLATGYIYQTPSIASGQLVLMACNLTVRNAGSLIFLMWGGNLGSYATVAGVTNIVTTRGTGSYGFGTTNSFNGSIDDAVIQKIIAPGSTGCSIYSTSALSTNSWGGVDSSFNPNAIASYTLESIPLINNVSNSAFIIADTVSSITGASDWSTYYGYRLTAKDSSGYQAIGWVGAKGTGVSTFGANGYAGYNFTVGWAAYLATVIDATSFWNKPPTVAGGVRKEPSPVLVAGQLYAGAVDATVVGGTYSYFRGSNSSIVFASAATGASTFKTASLDEAILLLSTGSGATTTVTGLHLDKVLTPGSTGCSIYSGPGLATNSWASVDASFNPNGIVSLTLDLIPNGTYDLLDYSSSPMFIPAKTTELSAVGISKHTEALRNNPGARIIFESAKGSAESTIGAWSGAAVGLGAERSPDVGFDDPPTWTLVGSGVVAGSLARIPGTGSGVHRAGWAATTRGQIIQITHTVINSNATGSLISNTSAASGPFIAYFYLSSANGTHITYGSPTTASSTANEILSLSGASCEVTQYGLKQLTSPGPNGCLLGPVTVRGSFDANKITKFKIIRPVSPREQRRHRTGPWRVVWDSSVN